MRGFYGVLLIATLVVVGGLIAFVGDILARRLGRKRISLFGLRPRHTAIGVAAVVGMLITLFTLFSAMLVSQDVKDGFLRVEYMRRRQTELTHQVDGLSARITELDAARKAAERRLAGVKGELADRQTELKDAKKALADTEAELARSRADLARTRVELARLSRELKQGTKAFARQTQIQEELRSAATRAARGYALGREVPVLFGAGQPLDLQLIAGGRSVLATHQDLDRLVDRVSSKVMAAGARPLPGSKEAVVIAVHDPNSNQVTVARRYQVLEAIAQRIHESDGTAGAVESAPADSRDVIVRVYSLFNTHPLEPVYIDFELFKNVRVFAKGETLAETVIDGRLSDSALMGALVSLLRDEVGDRARKKDVMPRLTPGSSSVFGSAAGAVGEMSYDDLFGTMNRLRRANGPARVRAVAADDVWTIGPLTVELRVEPLQVQAAR